MISEKTHANIPEEHKQMVQEGIDRYADNPESYLTWEEIDSKIRLD